VRTSVFCFATASPSWRWRRWWWWWPLPPNQTFYSPIIRSIQQLIKWSLVIAIVKHKRDEIKERRWEKLKRKLKVSNDLKLVANLKTDDSIHLKLKAALNWKNGICNHDDFTNMRTLFFLRAVFKIFLMWMILSICNFNQQDFWTVRRQLVSA